MKKVIWILCLCLMYSCGQTEQELEPMDPALVLPADDNLSLSATGYNGINIGDSIINNERLRLTNIENGEGSFPGYKIMHKELGAVGYALPMSTNNDLIGQIVIDMIGIETNEGISVGKTFADLRTKYPALEVHGSETEGIIYATSNGLHFKLDAKSTKYNLDQEPAADTKILAIVLRK
jgi:hypothetical protein